MEKNILRKAIDTYGEQAQEDMFIEESAELIKAILKYRRLEARTLKNLNEDYSAEIMVLLGNIAEEIADCLITIEQLKMIFNCEDEVKEQVEFKINRLKERLNNEKLS